MIIIMGSVGSGKSEQTTRLAKRLGIPRISTSQLIRDNLKPEWQARLLRGDLIDDAEVIELLDARFKQLGADKNEILLDGSPRSVGQAEWLTNQIKKGDIKLTAVIKLKVSKEVVVERLLKRGRDDDKEAVISHRLEAYESVTEPAIEYFLTHGVEVAEVDGEATPDGVETQIIKILGK